MDENHQDKTESKTPATEAKVSVPSEKKVGMPKHNGTRKWGKSLAKLFKVWATSLTILIAIAALLWGVYQFNAQQAVNQSQALDQQRQMTLNTYLDRMSDLLLLYHLANLKPGDKQGDEVQALAQARTYTTLRNLDGSRRGALIRFLWGARLINGQQPIISLSHAVLDGADLSNALLSGATLGCYSVSGKDYCANLSGATLTNADLSGVNLKALLASL